jgi:hypothetical protein
MFTGDRRSMRRIELGRSTTTRSQEKRDIASCDSAMSLSPFPDPGTSSSDQNESLEMTSLKARVASARQGIGLMLDLRKRTDPSPMRKFEPPGWRLQ